MNLLKYVLMALVIYISPNDPQPTASKTTYHFKKGEIFDVTFILERESVDNDSLFKAYRKTLFPIATKYSFKPVKGYGIQETLQGGYQPNYMALGKWKSLQQRRDFIEDIPKLVPEFHHMRRGLWSSFDLTYYEMEEDLSFTIDKARYTVVTAYWMKGKRGDKFIRQWKKHCDEQEGEVIVELKNGEAPSGYYYNPDYFFITEWTSKVKYERFIKQLEKLDASSITNINEFRI